MFEALRDGVEEKERPARLFQTKTEKRMRDGYNQAQAWLEAEDRNRWKIARAFEVIPDVQNLMRFFKAVMVSE